MSGRVSDFRPKYVTNVHNYLELYLYVKFDDQTIDIFIFSVYSLINISVNLDTYTISFTCILFTNQLFNSTCFYVS